MRPFGHDNGTRGSQHDCETPWQRSKPPSVLIDVSSGLLGRRLLCSIGDRSAAICSLARFATSGPPPGAHNVTLAIVGSHTEDGRASDWLIRQLRAVLPATSIFVCTSTAERGYARIREYAWAGADDLVLIDSPAEYAALLEEIRTRILAPPPAEVLRDISAQHATRGRTIGQWCVRAGYTKRTLGAVARWFEIDVKTANRHCFDAGLVGASGLLRSGRLHHAEEIRRRAKVSVPELARRLGFPSAKAFDTFRWRAREAGLPSIRPRAAS